MAAAAPPSQLLRATDPRHEVRARQPVAHRPRLVSSRVSDQTSAAVVKNRGESLHSPFFLLALPARALYRAGQIVGAMPTPSDVQASYDQVAMEYARRIHSELAHKPFDRELLDGFATRVKGKGPVGDMGCGPGMVAAYLAAQGVSSVFGLDLSPKMVAEATSLYPGVDFRTGDFHKLDAADDSLAGITAFYSLIHVARDEVQAVLREFQRALMPGGPLLISFHVGTEVRHASEWWGAPVDIDFVFFETSEMLTYVWNAGFDSELDVEREPYPEVELQTRRGYILARKPDLSAPVEPVTGEIADPV
jgi:SAM-dependent methyltransferase